MTLCVGIDKLPDRIRSKIVGEPDGCWYWIAYRDRRGYGHLNNGRGKTSLAHRVVYELLVGPIAPGLHADHLCSVRHCVNPKHIEPVTPRENMLRIVRSTHCINGHEYTPENTRLYLRKDGYTQRVCRACKRSEYTPADRTHCDYGHELTGDNAYTGSHGKPRCRTCSRIIQQANAARQRAKKVAS